MNTKLSILLFILFGIHFSGKAQCVFTQTANLTISTTMVVPASSNGVLLICPTGVAYDTLQTTNITRYYLEPGAKLILKNGSTKFIHMKTTSSYTNTGYAPFNKLIYTETGTNLVNLSTGTLSPISCSVVTFPSSASCTTTGLTEATVSNQFIVFPNPASDHITVINDNTSDLNAVIVNSIGQKVKSFTVENGNKIIDVSNLQEGIYFLKVLEKNKIISTQKIIIAK